MLWRVRTTLPDRPGALAVLAQECGKAGVNIVGLQVFPARDSVTDELVLSTSEEWTEDDLESLLERAGGERVVIRTATEEALADQPTRYVRAAQAVIDQPASFPEVVARLFDADVHPDSAHEQDVMELEVGEVQVQVRRRTPFTGVEHARGVAMAELVGDVLARDRPAVAPSSSLRMGAGAEPQFVADVDGAVALSDGVAVGRTHVRAASADEPGTCPVDLEVDAAWQGRGIGTRLLGEAVRVARSRGADEILLTTAADNRAVMPMVMAAGLRGRIRMAGDTLTVRIAVRNRR